jgi:microcystin-dependent protein
MKIWPRVAPPDNWILCQGQSLLQSGIYNPLFVVIGTTFGSVDGTHFNLPDMRGRVPVGLDIGGGPMGTLADTLGEKYGSAAHTLVQAEIPLHSHPPDTGGTTFLVSNGTFPGSGGRIITNSPGGMHFTLDVTTDQYGGSGPHNNVQPSIALQYVIRFA